MADQEKLHVSRYPNIATLGLMVLSLSIACLVAEGLARLLFEDWAPRTARLTQFWKYDETYGWAHIPGTTGQFTGPSFNSTVSINSKGFRGPVVEYERTTKRPRVLLIGDSFVWGFGVPFEHTFGAQLERLMPDLEVVNLGVSGYSTDQELLLYRNEGRKYHADLVVVVVAANDLEGNLRTEEYLIYGKPAFVPTPEGGLRIINQPVHRVSWLRRAAVQVASNSYLLTRVQRIIYEQRIAEGLAASQSHEPTKSQEDGGKTNDPSRRPRSEVVQDVTAQLLVEFNKEVQTDDSRFLVVFVDSIRSVPRLVETLAKSGIETVFLSKSINSEDALMHLPGDFHWNAAGHLVVARALMERVMDIVPSMGVTTRAHPLSSQAISPDRTPSFP